MNARVHRNRSWKERLLQIVIVCLMIALAALAVAGPYGLLAWGENRSVLDKRETRIAELEAKRDEYSNLVDRLDPEHVDPDLATELVRKNLNVAHPDEYIIELETE